MDECVRHDLQLGVVTLVGDWNWRRGPKWKAACALVLGRRQRYEHLGKRMVVSWWRGQPYLIRLGEARP